MNHLQKFKEQVSSIEESTTISTQNGSFKVSPVLIDNYLVGVNVDNLDDSSKFLPIEVFAATISLLSLSPDKKADKGRAMDNKLGDPDLPTNSVEGHVAHVVYGKENGDSIYRRITPIARLLEWANVCENGRGYLKLI